MTETEFSAAPAADAGNVEMADTLRQDGKIYVVVTVLVTIMAGIVVYLVSLDRKVSKLEKQLKDDYVNR
nr:CcmD family protein [Pontibacter liquoris]